MKTIALLASLLAAAPACAAGRAGVVSLSLNGGAAQPLGTAWVRERTKLGPAFGGAVHFGLSEHVELALSYDSLRMYKTRQVLIDTALASLVHYYDLGGRLSPAMRLGVGPAVVHNARPDGVPNHNTFAARVGAGLDYKLTERYSTGLWADYLVAARAVRKTPEVHAATVGLSLRWTGGAIGPRTAKAAKAEAPSDDREPGQPAPVKAAAPAPAPEPEAAPAPAPKLKPAPKAAPKARTRRPVAPAPAEPTETPAAVQEAPGEE